MRVRKAGPTKRERTSALPPQRPGEAFDLIGTLRRCTCMLSQSDAAKLLGVSRTTIARHVQEGRIPVLEVGLDKPLIDPSIWATWIEFRNKHAVHTRNAKMQHAA